MNFDEEAMHKRPPGTSISAEPPLAIPFIPVLNKPPVIETPHKNYGTHPAPPGLSDI